MKDICHRGSTRTAVLYIGMTTLAFSIMLAFAGSCSNRDGEAKSDGPRVGANDSPVLADVPEIAQRVLIVSFDGLRPDAISKAHTPTLVSLVETGSSQLSALAEVPCITLPNHSSMVTGLTVPHHGVLFNSDHAGRIDARTIFDVARDAQIPVGFFATKAKLNYLCGDNDAEICEIKSKVEALADEVVKAIQERDLRLMFVHFGEPDGAGHAHGWMTKKYFAAASRSDTALARILAALDEKGIRDETVVMVSADHGGHGKIHGFDIPEDRLIPFIIQGPGIAAGRTLCKQIRTMDTAAMALHLLGLPTESAKDGQAVFEAMSESATTPCDQPAQAFSMPCGPLPLLFYGPIVLGMWVMRLANHRRIRN